MVITLFYSFTVVIILYHYSTIKTGRTRNTLKIYYYCQTSWNSTVRLFKTKLCHGGVHQRNYVAKLQEPLHFASDLTLLNLSRTLCDLASNRDSKPRTRSPHGEMGEVCYVFNWIFHINMKLLSTWKYQITIL